jgi:hypothetical protein
MKGIIILNTQLISIFIFQLLSPLLISPRENSSRRNSIKIDLITPLILMVNPNNAFPVLAEKQTQQIDKNY